MRLFSSRNNIAILQNSRVGVCLTLLLLLPLLFSCASVARYKGVGRIRRYTVADARLPQAFDGMTVAFLSDTHYPSKFTPKRLQNVVRALGDLHPDLLLLGGDYVTDNDSIDALFGSLATVGAADGIFAVLGNHESRNGELVAQAMDANGIILLADSVAVIGGECDSIYVAGVYDSFAYDPLVLHPAERLPDDGFVILLCHTPDYAERSSTSADLVLAGHTHGGQVSLFGLYTPVKNTRYGTRFLRGRNRTTNGATVITTNGVGTSRRKVRFCVPSEIVVVTLKSEK